MGLSLYGLYALVIIINKIGLDKILFEGIVELWSIRWKGSLKERPTHYRPISEWNAEKGKGKQSK